MLSKCRFKLISYITLDEILFYKSINRNQKIIGFSIIKTTDINETINILNKFLSKAFLSYFSLQIYPIRNYDNKIILNFQDRNQKNIIKFFNILKLKVKNNINDISFLKGKELEKEFFDLGFSGNNPNTIIIENEDHLSLNNKTDSITLNFYEIVVNEFLEKKMFHNLTNLLKSSKIDGLVIFNFRYNINDSINSSGYIITINEKKDLQIYFNKFFGIGLINKIRIKSSLFPNLIWRRNLTDSFYKYCGDLIFNLPETQDLYEEERIRNRLIQKFKSSKIKYITLNPNLYLVMKGILILIIINLDQGYIMKFLKKYNKKYKIIIILKDIQGYNQLIAKKEFKSLNKVKIFSENDFFNKITLE